MDTNINKLFHTDVELGEFLLYIGEQMAQVERNNCVNMPPKDKYVAEVGKLASIFPSQISDDVHFRKWL